MPRPHVEPVGRWSTLACVLCDGSRQLRRPCLWGRESDGLERFFYAAGSVAGLCVACVSYVEREGCHAGSV